MSIAFGTIGAVANGATSLSVAYPASIAAGDLLLLGVASKYDPNNPLTPTGFTPLHFKRAGSGGAGADSGVASMTVWYRIATGSEAGSISVSIPSGNTCLGVCARYTKSATADWALAITGGDDTNPSTTFFDNLDANLGIQTGDVCVMFGAENTDANSAGHNPASTTLAATGCTFSSTQERADLGTSNGDDCGLIVTEHTCTAGQSTGIPSYTITGLSSGANHTCGAMVLVRMRELTGGGQSLVGSRLITSITFAASVGLRVMRNASNYTLTIAAGTYWISGDGSSSDLLKAITDQWATQTGVADLSISINGVGLALDTTRPLGSLQFIALNATSANLQLSDALTDSRWARILGWADGAGTQSFSGTPMTLNPSYVHRFGWYPRIDADEALPQRRSRRHTSHTSLGYVDQVDWGEYDQAGYSFGAVARGLVRIAALAEAAVTALNLAMGDPNATYERWGIDAGDASRSWREYPDASDTTTYRGPYRFPPGSVLYEDPLGESAIRERGGEIWTIVLHGRTAVG